MARGENGRKPVCVDGSRWHLKTEKEDILLVNFQVYHLRHRRHGYVRTSN